MSDSDNTYRRLEEQMRVAATKIPVSVDARGWEALAEQLDAYQGAVSDAGASTASSAFSVKVILTVVGICAVAVCTFLLTKNSEPLENKVPEKVIITSPIDTGIEEVGVAPDTLTLPPPVQQSAPKEEEPISKKKVIEKEDTLITDSVKTDSLDNFIFW